MTLTILIPAAGSSTRMRGGDKLLERVAGEPMLHRQARIALQVCPKIIVTLRQNDLERRAVLNDLAITALPVPDAAEGMAASIRAGATRAKTALMILPADMPDLTATDLQQLIDTFDQSPTLIHRACTADGQPGHPVIFPRDLLNELQTLTGDEGARSVLQRHKSRINLITLPDRHAATDLDTPEDWAAWRALGH